MKTVEQFVQEEKARRFRELVDTKEKCEKLWNNIQSFQAACKHVPKTDYIGQISMTTCSLCGALCSKDIPL